MLNNKSVKKEEHVFQNYTWLHLWGVLLFFFFFGFALQLVFWRCLEKQNFHKFKDLLLSSALPIQTSKHSDEL